VKFKGECC
jgi:hypothetical protein